MDNASTDFTHKLLQTIGEPGTLRVITYKENLGFVKSYNSIWPIIETPLLLLLSNDVTVERNCISNMIHTAESDSKIGIVGAVQYHTDGSRDPPYRWFHRSGSEIGKIFKTESTTSPPGETESVGFACALIKKEVWKTIGYFDEIFYPCMFEQEDYCLRAKKEGFEIVVDVSAHFVHLVAATTSLNYDYFQKIIEVNYEKFKQKWGEKLGQGKV